MIVWKLCKYARSIIRVIVLLLAGTHTKYRALSICVGILFSLQRESFTYYSPTRACRKGNRRRKGPIIPNALYVTNLIAAEKLSEKVSIFIVAPTQIRTLYLRVAIKWMLTGTVKRSDRMLHLEGYKMIYLCIG